VASANCSAWARSAFCFWLQGFDKPAEFGLRGLNFGVAVGGELLEVDRDTGNLVDRYGEGSLVFEGGV